MELPPDTSDIVVGRDALHDILQRLGAQLLRRIGPFYVYENRAAGQPFIVEWDKWDFTWDEAILIVTKNGFDPEKFKTIYIQDYGFAGDGGG